MSAAGGAVFVMPRRPEEWSGAAALWVTVAGWASAARRALGASWVVSPAGVVSADEALDFTRPRGGPATNPRARYLPVDLRNALKDAARWRTARGFTDAGEPPEWKDEQVAFVWQHHDLFHNAGAPVARRHACPLVTYVHAPQVWEARRWGVRRPGYGDALVRVAERPQLTRSDVVCCVSDEVASELVRLGVEREKILVSPMAVDATRFTPEVSGQAVRARLGLGDAFVVGWTGSFRGFHGLETVIDSFGLVHREDPTARLLLVGSGSERDALQAHARDLDLVDAVVFAGEAGNIEIPAYVAAMDVALVSARPGDAFHYSPLKLREYLACGRAVVAPRLGEIPRTVTEGQDALLYEPGDAHDLATQLDRLRRDPELRHQLAEAGHTVAVETSTWDVRLHALLESTAFAHATEYRK